MTRSIKSRLVRKERQQLTAELTLYGYVFTDSYEIQNTTTGYAVNLSGTRLWRTPVRKWGTPIVPSLTRVSMQKLRLAVHYAKAHNED